MSEQLIPKRALAESATEMVQVVLPNDANPLGFILGGTVMHLIDIAGAIACHRHTRSLLVTAAVDGLQFLHPIKVGDLIILKARVTAAWSTSLEVEVEVFSEETLTGVRRMTSRAYLTFVVDRSRRAADADPGADPGDGRGTSSAPAEADQRRAERLKARKELETRATEAPRMDRTRVSRGSAAYFWKNCAFIGMKPSTCRASRRARKSPRPDRPGRRRRSRCTRPDG